MPCRPQKATSSKKHPDSCPCAYVCVCVRVDIHHSVYCVSRSLSLRSWDYISVYGADKSASSTSLVFSHALPFRAGHFPSSSRVIMPGFDVRHPRSRFRILLLCLFSIYIYSLSYSILI